MVVSYKGQYWGGETYLISHKNKSKQALLFKTAHNCLFCDIWLKKNFAPNFEQPPNMKKSQQDSHKFQQSS
jgi:hypothetical protein